MPSFLRGALLLAIVGSVLLIASRNDIAARFAQGLIIGSILLVLVNGQTASNIVNWVAGAEQSLAQHQGKESK